MLGGRPRAYCLDMKQTRRIASAAWRRVVARECVCALGVSLTAGAALGGFGAVCARLIWASDTGTAWVALGAGVGAGALAGLVVGWVRARRIGVSGATIEVDRALGFSDRLSSALTFDAREDEAFVALARADAERVARGAKARRAVRVRFGSWWGVWPVVVAAGLGVGLWVPAMTLFDSGAKQERLRLVALQQERQDAAKDVRAAREALLEAPEEAGAVSEEELRTLEEIERELERGNTGGEEARAIAAAALEEMAREREALERRAQEQVEEIASRVASSGGGGDRSGRAAELREAMARGDLAAAAEALEALEEPGAMSEEEMLELAREMEEIAKALEGTGEQDENASQDGADQGAKELSESLKEAAREVNEQCEGGGEAGESGKSGDSEKSSSGSASTGGGKRSGSASSGQQGEGGGQTPKGEPRGQAGQGKKGGERASSESVRRAREALERLGQEQQGASEAGQRAKDLRGAAKRLMAGEADESGEEMDTGVGAAGGQKGRGAGSGSQGMLTREPVEAPPVRTADVDARHEGVESAGKSRSFEWYNPNAREGRGTVDGRVAAERLREAAKSAERAIEDQTLPSKYSRLLREYYRRMPDAVKPSESESAPAETKPADDSTPKSE